MKKGCLLFIADLAAVVKLADVYFALTAACFTGMRKVVQCTLDLWEDEERQEK